MTSQDILWIQENVQSAQGKGWEGFAAFMVTGVQRQAVVQRERTDYAYHKAMTERGWRLVSVEEAAAVGLIKPRGGGDPIILTQAPLVLQKAELDCRSSFESSVADIPATEEEGSLMPGLEWLKKAWLNEAGRLYRQARGIAKVTFKSETNSWVVYVSMRHTDFRSHGHIYMDLTEQSVLPAPIRETLVEAVDQGKTMTITWKLPQEITQGLGLAIIFYVKDRNEKVKYTKWHSSFKRAEGDKMQEGIYQVNHVLPTLKDPAAVGVRIVKGFIWPLKYDGELHILDVSIDGQQILPPPLPLTQEKVSRAPQYGTSKSWPTESMETLKISTSLW